MANSCQEKVAGDLFRLNYSIHQHALALKVIQVYCLECVGTFFNLAKVNTIPCMRNALSRTTS